MNTLPKRHILVRDNCNPPIRNSHFGATGAVDGFSCWRGLTAVAQSATKCLAFLGLAILLSRASFGQTTAAQPPIVEPFLQQGQLTRGEVTLMDHLRKNPNDDQARFGLGMLQFFQSVEHLGTKLHQFAPTNRVAGMPFIRLPVTSSDNPRKVTYENLRQVFEELLLLLEKSENTLAAVKSKDVKLPIHVFSIHIDFDENGKVDEAENIKGILGRSFGIRPNRLNNAVNNPSDVVIAFDYSDVQWLRGYTHALRAMCEFFLAYDHSDCWNVVAHRLFKKGQIPFDFVAEEKTEPNGGLFGNLDELRDVIAAIHNMRFPLIDGQRMRSAHAHLKRTVAISKSMWKLILAETDNENEWIPNPKQISAVTVTRVTGPMVESWDDLLDEVDLILDGKKLIPFWRGEDNTRGINLKKVFHEPREFDVVLWVHGSAAAPYLEKGDVTAFETWQQYQRSFGGNLFSFAGWFN